MKFGHKIYAASEGHELGPCFFDYKAVKKKIKKMSLLGPGAERSEQILALLNAISAEVCKVNVTSSSVRAELEWVSTFLPLADAPGADRLSVFVEWNREALRKVRRGAAYATAPTQTQT